MVGLAVQVYASGQVETTPPNYSESCQKLAFKLMGDSLTKAEVVCKSKSNDSDAYQSCVDGEQNKLFSKAMQSHIDEFRANKCSG